MRRDELRQRVLEVTVWDYDRFGANEFLGGKLKHWPVSSALCSRVKLVLVWLDLPAAIIGL